MNSGGSTRLGYWAMALLALLLQSCSAAKVVDVKSPCVSGEEGPCGPRKPVNEWWLRGLRQETLDLG
ncbi:MAG: hypothetical protein LBU15_01370 [Rickettsiales bacterium]|jgi:hypothetical protein|nr:hypothetical protein [Rickettsiales bacterium]